MKSYISIHAKTVYSLCTFLHTFLPEYFNIFTLSGK